MIFYKMLPGQKLILRKARPRPQAARPITARRPAAVESLLIKLILWLLTTFAAPTVAVVRHVRRAWPPTIPVATKQKMAVLGFILSMLATVILEILAQNYIDRIFGV